MAAMASLAAQRQGKFWQMHDALFARHADLSEQAILAIAKDIALNVQRFESDLHSPAIQELMQRDIADGDRAGVQGTPTLFIDGQRFNGPINLESLKPVLDQELKTHKDEVKTTAALNGSKATH